MKRARSLSASQSTQLVRSGTASSYGSKRTRGTRVTGNSRKSFGTVGLSKYTGFGFPPKIQVKHRYQEINAIVTAAGGGSGSYQFRANGMYDPNVTGTGHQPLYFDQLAAVYDHFTVLKSYLKLTLSTPSADTQQVVVFLNDDSTIVSTSMATLMEQSSAKYIQFNVNSGPVVLYIGFNAYKTYGGSILGNDNLQGTAAADPTEQTVYSIVGNAVDISKATNINFNAEIVYTAVWDEIRDIAGS